MSPADEELWSEARSSDGVGSEADFSCRCGTAVTWRSLPPPSIIQSGTRCLQPNTLAWPWHVPSRHPHQSRRGSPGPLPAATSGQLVQTWRETAAKRPAPGSSCRLRDSRGWFGCVVGATAGWVTCVGIVMGVCETSAPTGLSPGCLELLCPCCLGLVVPTSVPL